MVFTTAACLIAAPVCLYRYFAPLPALTDLQVVSGTVASATSSVRDSRYNQSTDLDIRFEGDSAALTYLAWFPNTAAIASEVQAGDSLVVWSDLQGSSWIWQIEKDGERVVSYEQVVDSIHQNNRLDGLLGVALLGVGLWGAHRFWLERKAPDEENSLRS